MFALKAARNCPAQFNSSNVINLGQYLLVWVLSQYSGLREVNRILKDAYRCECEYEWLLFPICQPCYELLTCPGGPPLLAQ